MSRELMREKTTRRVDKSKEIELSSIKISRRNVRERLKRHSCRDQIGGKLNVNA
jgi:hypothetical protein